MTSDQQQRRVLILFTDWFNHFIQRGSVLAEPLRVAAYRRRITRLASEHALHAIAEEMNWDSMARCVAENILYRQTGVMPEQRVSSLYIEEHLKDTDLKSETAKVAHALQIPYLPCDLPENEQRENGPLDPPDATAEGIARWEDLTFPPRERAWIANFLHLNQWPVLFVCGRSHQRTFLPRLAEAHLEVVILNKETEPDPRDLSG